MKKNEEIRGKTVRVIGPEGNQLGIMLVEQARMKAVELEMDLVEVAPLATPPVCRIMDFGKHLYQEQKKEHKARKKSHAGEMKEVRLKPRIGKHDLTIKVQRAKEFLDEGHRVQFTMVYRGREITHQDIGEQILKEVVLQVQDICKVERGPFRDGKRVGLIVAPKLHGVDPKTGAPLPPPKAAASKPATPKPVASKPAAAASPTPAPAATAPAKPAAAANPGPAPAAAVPAVADKPAAP